MTKGDIDGPRIVKMLGDAPSGMFNHWPPGQFLADLANVKGFNRVLNSTAVDGHYDIKWGGYYELFVAKRLKDEGATISELRLKLTKDITGLQYPTDLDIVVNGGAKVYEVKYSVKAFAPKSTHPVGSVDWIEDAKRAQMHWIAQAQKYNSNAELHYIYHTGDAIPASLKEFLEDFATVAQRGINGN